MLQRLPIYSLVIIWSEYGIHRLDAKFVAGNRRQSASVWITANRGGVFRDIFNPFLGHPLYWSHLTYPAFAAKWADHLLWSLTTEEFVHCDRGTDCNIDDWWGAELFSLYLPGARHMFVFDAWHDWSRMMDDAWNRLV